MRWSLCKFVFGFTLWHRSSSHVQRNSPIYQLCNVWLKCGISIHFCLMCGYVIHFTLSTHHGKTFSMSRPRMSYGSVFVLVPKCLVPGLATIDVCRIWNLNRYLRVMGTIIVNRDHQINLSGCNVISFLQDISDLFISFKGTVLIEAWFNSGIVEITLNVLVSMIMTPTTFTYTCLSCHISHNLGCTAQTKFCIPYPWKQRFLTVKLSHNHTMTSC